MRIYLAEIPGGIKHHEAGLILLRYAVSNSYKVDCTGFETVYGENGKPYFKDRGDIFFNISHSGDYAVCAVGEEPLGIDIQKDRKVRREVCERYLGGCPEEDGARMWAKREAYGKFTGEGALGKFGEKKCVFREYPVLSGYYIFAACESGDFPDMVETAEIRKDIPKAEKSEKSV